MTVETAGPRTGATRLWQLAPPEWYAMAAMLSIAVATYIFITGDRQSQELLNPAVVAAIMVANLVPAMTLIVLIGSRLARGRAARSLQGGNGRLHVRLVALFSLIAAAPTLLVVIFASLLFQQGVDFWFSDKSRGMFENAANLAEGYYQENQREVGANTIAMAKDLRTFLARAPINDPRFADYYLQQVVVRNLNESAIIEVGRDGVARTPAMVDPDNRAAENRISAGVIAQLNRGRDVIVARSGDRIEAATRLDPNRAVYLYASRDSNVLGAQPFESPVSIQHRALPWLAPAALACGDRRDCGGGPDCSPAWCAGRRRADGGWRGLVCPRRTIAAR
jgi:two-component system, NtrC family, nitrogen regulation sensor histidine kinase NtrY